MRRRVVITGFACATPLGCTPDQFWNNLAAGRSGIAPITLFDAAELPVRIAAEVKDWHPESAGPLVDGGRQSRQTEFAVGAALQAARHAGVTSTQVDPDRLGVYLGCGEAYPDFMAFAATVAATVGAEPCLPEAPASSFETLAYEPDAPLGFIASELDARGPSANYTTACVSSSVAVGEAVELVRGGTADIILAGGAHSMIHPFGITGLHRLSTLTTRCDDPARAYRPFDLERDGFVVGEGGAVMVLEDLEHARRRGATIWAEVIGYGSTHDAFRITDPRPDGAAAARCIRLALKDAEIDAERIDYINAHGSGTQLNDRAETEAIKAALGDHAYHVPVSSTKSMTGHLTTACGAIELLACVLALHHQAVPPTINYETPDPFCDLDYVPNTARDHRCRCVLNNNFGFGGHNVSLVLAAPG